MKRFRRFGASAPLLAWFLFFLAPSSRLAADFVYGITGAGGGASSLFTINPTNGSATLIQTVKIGGTGVMLSSIAFDPVNHQLYGAALVGGMSVGNGELVTINLTTAAATVVGTFGLGPANNGINMTSLAFSSTGTLYAYAHQGTLAENLFTVNTTTGLATAIGPSGVSSSGDGLAMNASGTLYFAGSGDNGPLYTLNSSTGLATAGPTLSNAPNNGGQIKGLAFDSSGTLYGIDIVQGMPFTANLVTINPTTGVITNLGSTQNGLVSVAFESTTPEPGCLVLMGLAALGLFVHARTRRAKTQDALQST